MLRPALAPNWLGFKMATTYCTEVAILVATSDDVLPTIWNRQHSLGIIMPLDREIRGASPRGHL
jgi:hypothetical protein